MIRSTLIYETDCLNPHVNLATEDALMRALPGETAILFLWQNRHTVVVGAGQNAWSECRTALLEREGGVLARRSSGGGAVYHDMGNLNFSFIVPRADYDVARQLSVVRAAVGALGANAQATGRNDLTVDGRKFSGNAFRLLKDTALHHGTLLCNADMDIIGRYLNVSPDKLKAKGVKSVPARVINLSAVCPGITVDALKGAMARAFFSEYGDGAIAPVGEAILPDLPALLEKYQSWAWNYGASPQGEAVWRHRFSWGGVEIFATVRAGTLRDVSAYTDAMDETLRDRLTGALEGCAMHPDALRAAVATIQPELAAWLADQA